MQKLLTLGLLFIFQIGLSQPVIEFGYADVGDTWLSIQTDDDFMDPVVIAMPPTDNEVDPVSVRIRSVNPGYFEVKLGEPTTQDGVHVPERIHYMIVEKGRHVFSDGTIVEAGTVAISNDIPIDVDFIDKFNGIPILFTQIQTNFYHSNYFRSRSQISTDSTFALRLEGEVGGAPWSTSNDVAYVAISEGSGSFDGLQYEAKRVGSINTFARVVGFAGDFDTDVHCIVAMQTDIGTDPTGLRLSNLTNQFMNIFLQEDQLGAHTNEEIGYLVVNDYDTTIVQDPGRLQIVNVNPSTGPTTGGTFVKIEGLNFGSSTHTSVFAGQINFDSVQVPANDIILVDESLLKFRLPEGIGVDLPIEIVMNGITTVSPQTFSYDSPVIISTSLSGGNTMGGDSINVFGNNFGPSKQDVSVTLGGINTPIGAFTSTMFRIASPPGFGRNKDLIVDVDGNLDTLENAFSYNGPQLFSVPNLISTFGSNSETILGSNFGNNLDSLKVFLDDVELNINSLMNHGQMNVSIPSGVGASKTWKVTIGGQSAEIIGGFSYAAPSIISVTTFGPSIGGTPLSLIGQNFGDIPDSVQLFLGNTPVSVQAVNHSQIVGTLPPGTGTNLPIALHVGNQQVVELNAFSYYGPQIFGINPSSAPTLGGDTIVILGQNFGHSTENVLVKLDTVDMPLISVNDGSIAAIIPPGTGINKDISVSVSGQLVALPGSFSYLAPVIDASSNNCLIEGESITFYGSNFGPAASVMASVNGQPVSTNNQNQQAFSITIPSGLNPTNTISVSVEGQASSPFMLAACADEMIKMDNAFFQVNSSTAGIIFKTLNGSCWKLFVDEDGNLLTESVPCTN